MASRSARGGRGTCTLSDRALLDLIRRFQQKDPSAWSKLSTAMEEILRSVLKGRADIFDSPEDAWQEASFALVAVLRAFDISRKPPDLRQAIRADLRNKLFPVTKKALREKRERKKSDPLSPQAPGEEPEEEPSLPLPELLDRAVKAGVISSIQRELLLAKAAGISAAQVGREFGLTPENARQIRLRGEKALASGRKGKVHEWHRERKNKRTR